MASILVTGGSGFLGSNLCIRLINEGNKVICVDNNYTGRMKNLASIIDHPNFSFINHDVINPIEIDGYLDEIYHLACPASPPAYQGKAAIMTTKTCVYGAVNLLELAKEKNAKILLSSTSEVYGDPLVHPQVESYRGNVNPNGIRACYDEGKRCAESLFFDYYREENVRIKVIRIFNTYGPRMDPKDGRVVSNFICQALRGEDITIYGQGTQTRSFCYVDDLIDAIIKMMKTSDDFVGPVNTGNPGEFTIKELAEKVIAKVGGTSRIVYCDLPKDDPTQRKPDISLANEKLSWQPKVDLDHGLDKTIEYFKSEIINEYE
ncbi:MULTISPECIES: UDP-glucuronic acid decarboxylase family protein [unclassified Gilliamella]|uniref:UDP-glucuronic acid decarboxylase family protein n=1 Tax=unclassified Gilliamella TaxID=2685620 RepID=UPI00130B4ACA|nr:MULTISPECIES: UDP-glucuronic acid decarboxylase family protein [unclassified Gilliamella]MWP48890.1 NAD-dependent epimerase/dehydratase family protein [Gilliamella sp. Lep-s35]MWP68766.1 NAD-dependent epimerase/dehydratase family protein [Gilliamella sp. Lep-s5]MWP77161.1 NAD-dependent epimerase/dehydratase family protein [Gilliamella sp. Lep-s21]